MANDYPVVSYQHSQHLSAFLRKDVLHVHQRYFLLRHGDYSSGVNGHRRPPQGHSGMEKVQEDGESDVESAYG